MLNKRSIVVSLLLLTMLLLSACAGNTATQAPAAQPGGAGQGAETPATGEMTIDANSPAVVAAIAAVSETTGISADQISFVSAQAQQWTDSCLGLGGPAESCLQVITPGYNIMLSAQGTNYEVHTNEDGSTVRIKTP